MIHVCVCMYVSPNWWCDWFSCLISWLVVAFCLWRLAQSKNTRRVGVSSCQHVMVMGGRDVAVVDLPDVGKQIQYRLILLLTTRFAKDIPKAQRLIAGTGDNCLAIGTECQIEHPIGVTRQLGHLRQRWIFPHKYLVLWVAVCGDQLRWVLRPGQIAHLRASVHALHGLTRQRIPEAYATIRCAAPAGQQPVMMWRPGDCLHRRHVFRIRLHRIGCMLIPHIQTIVVATAGQILIVWRPFQPAHLLSMASKTPLRLQLGCTCVSLYDPSIPRPTRQDVTVPSQRTHACRVSIEFVNLDGNESITLLSF